MDEEKTRGTLEPKEPHPMALDAWKWIHSNYTYQDMMMSLEAFSSCSIEGNRLAEVCAETLDRLIKGDPVSDRYLLGLAWYMKKVKDLAKELERKDKKNVK